MNEIQKVCRNEDNRSNWFDHSANLDRLSVEEETIRLYKENLGIGGGQEEVQHPITVDVVLQNGRYQVCT